MWYFELKRRFHPKAVLFITIYLQSRFCTFHATSKIKIGLKWFLLNTNNFSSTIMVVFYCWAIPDPYIGSWFDISPMDQSFADPWLGLIPEDDVVGGKSKRRLLENHCDSAWVCIAYKYNKIITYIWYTYIKFRYL